MSLHRVSDEFLVRRAKRGDEAAFAELARRYRPLIAAATCPAVGVNGDDLRQEALIGLLEACAATDGMQRFAGIAKLRVQRKVATTRRGAARGKHRVLTDAARTVGDGEQDALALVAAPEGADPARVVELRERLGELLREHAEAAERRARAPGGDVRRRYSDEQIDRAVALVADGSTVAAAAAAVGAHYGAVREWVNKPRDGNPAALVARRAQVPDRALHRRYSEEQISRARALVADGHTIRGAAAAVGASHSTVLRWLRQAA